MLQRFKKCFLLNLAELEVFVCNHGDQPDPSFLMFGLIIVVALDHHSDMILQMIKLLWCWFLFMFSCNLEESSASFKQCFFSICKQCVLFIYITKEICLFKKKLALCRIVLKNTRLLPYLMLKSTSAFSFVKITKLIP